MNTAVVVVTFPGGDLSGGGERPTRHMTAAPHAGGGCRQTNIAERGWAKATSAICPPVPFVRNAETAVGRASINVDEQGKNGRQSPEFVRGLRAPGALSTRVNSVQEPARGLRECFHSFGWVSVHDGYQTMEGIPDDAKVTARPRNLTARGGNVSS